MEKLFSFPHLSGRFHGSCVSTAADCRSDGPQFSITMDTPVCVLNLNERRGAFHGTRTRSTYSVNSAFDQENHHQSGH